MRPKVDETDAELFVNLFVNPSGDTDAAGIGKILNPCSNVNTIPINTIILNEFYRTLPI